MKNPLLVVVILIGAFVAWKSFGDKNKHREGEDLKKTLREVMDSKIVQAHLQGAEQSKKGQDEKNFAIQKGYFIGDQSFVYYTNESTLYRVNLESGSIKEFKPGNTLNLFQTSSDGRYILHSDSRQVFDLDEGKDKKITDLTNLNDVQSGLGFGPTPEFFLVYLQKEKIFVMKNIFDGTEKWRLSVPEAPVHSFGSFWTPSRRYVLAHANIGDFAVLIDTESGKKLPMESNFPYTSSFIVEDSELGFAFAKNHSEKSRPFVYDLRGHIRSPLALNGEALGFSYQDDLFLMTSSNFSEVELRRPSKNFAVEKNFKISGTTFIRPRRSQWILSMDKNQLQAFDMNKNDSKSVGFYYPTFGEGILVASEDGKYIAHSIHRDLQIIPVSELSEEIPRYRRIVIKVPEAP